MSERQDIDTAPKDGTEFWAFDPTSNVDGTPYMQKCSWNWNGVWLMVDEQTGGGFEANPILWMPLPEPPLASSKPE